MEQRTTTSAELSLTEGDKAKIAAWQAQFDTNVCHACGNAEFSIQKSLMTGLGYSRATEGAVINIVMPVVIFMCKKCGNILQFSAQHIGLLNQEPPPDLASA